MTYQQAQEYLVGCCPGRIRPGLERMRRVWELSEPLFDGQTYIHVAGTNGKGSTAAMIAGILTAAGSGWDYILPPPLPGCGIPSSLTASRSPRSALRL